ncbi:hypothetical protein [Clostridium autoethanogenum]|uniref:Tumour necrosis factor receptor superfamily member 19 n=1 Tax=Clostridium autoethanogenum DSM 10061 TaxID=1341692 RepID=A0ABN4BDD2_9CLOT|nr:hypothetical protein [Clostridium autoethanogenum]AGY75328.1 hypothetical protein CAETHG_1103 [Clostridium autoethanogenum DSM 10061]ALU35493.1 Hypothetical protein CLAU_1064 [Clostridium autoethanogenum DSM 10061]OVY52445.1 hypothetical protein WX72_01344 [Clostridium autoethanogenum]
MNAYVIIVSIVCVTIVGIVSIFAMLAYLKEKAILKYKNNFKDSNSEISITVDDDKNDHSKN